MKQSIYTDIRTNIALRDSIANYLEITPHSVYSHAVRQAPTLNNFIIVEIIKKHTGKTIDEIFTKETLDYIK